MSSSIIYDNSNFQLSKDNIELLLAKIKGFLVNRAQKIYVFGSASTGDVSSSSDIDLIIVVEQTLLPFVERGKLFLDLFNIYPDLDILVYTPNELAAQLADSEVGFWKSVRLTMREL